MNESMERVLADWLREGPDQGPREGLERTLAATRRVRQRPGWTFPERWIPLELTMLRTPSQRPLLAFLTLALLVLAIVAAILVAGSNRPNLPAPFGPARNGAIVFERDGDLFIADALNAPSRTLVGGPDADTFPVFSRQGDRLAFVRGDGGGFDLMLARPDGTDVRVLASLPGSNAGLSWSPDGSAILMNYTPNGYITGFRLAIVPTDGSAVRELDVGRPADWASWRPDGTLIAFRGQLEDGTSAAFIANADGTDVRQLPMETTDLIDFEGLGWSPDGRHLSFMSSGLVSGNSMRWQIGIADIATDGTFTGHRYLRLADAASAEMLPAWSPDGSQLAFILENAGERQIAVAPADGSAPARLVGPSTSAASGMGHAWSPDGRTLTITISPAVGEPAFWSVDVASGAATQIENPGQVWQRLGS